MIYILTNIVTAAIMVALQCGGVQAIPVAKSLVDGTVIIGAGAVSGADAGLFERVAENRMNGIAEPTLPSDTDLQSYDALIATESCEYVGWHGKLVATDGDVLKEKTVLVVDCQNDKHKLNGGALSDLGLIADVSEPASDIWHYRGYLVLVED